MEIKKPPPPEGVTALLVVVDQIGIRSDGWGLFAFERGGGNGAFAEGGFVRRGLPFAEGVASDSVFFSHFGLLEFGLLDRVDQVVRLEVAGPNGQVGGLLWSEIEETIEIDVDLTKPVSEFVDEVGLCCQQGVGDDDCALAASFGSVLEDLGEELIHRMCFLCS